MSICHGTGINGANRVHYFVLGTLESARLESDDASIASLGTKAPFLVGHVLPSTTTPSDGQACSGDSR